MELNKQDIDKLLKLNDKDLQGIFESMCKNAGIPASKSKHILNDMNSIRNMMSDITPQQLEQAAKQIGKKEIYEMRKMMNGEQYGK